MTAPEWTSEKPPDSTRTAPEPAFRLKHIGVAVPCLNSARESFATLFDYEVVAGPFEDPIQKVAVLFLAKSPDDAMQIELVAPLSEDSPIRSMLARERGGAYHLCLETADLDAALAHAQRHGCVVVAAPQPAVAFQGRRIAWIYTPARLLFELVEDPAGRLPSE